MSFVQLVRGAQYQPNGAEQLVVAVVIGLSPELALSVKAKDLLYSDLQIGLENVDERRRMLMVGSQTVAKQQRQNFRP